MWLLLYQDTSKNIRKYMGTSLNKIMFAYLDFIVCQFWKRRAPENNEDPLNKISKILNMGPISIKNHEWIFANMVPISLSKHKMAFLGILKL